MRYGCSMAMHEEKIGTLAMGSMEDYRTRRRLIEAAGLLFAENGFDKATGRAICELAQVNPSAINYHFGSKDGLYLEVVREADNRFFNAGKLKALLDEEVPPEEKLRKLVADTSTALLGHSANTWHTKLMTREIIEPTKASMERAEKEIRPKFAIFREIVCQVMGVPREHPSAIRGGHSRHVANFFFVSQQIPDRTSYPGSQDHHEVAQGVRTRSQSLQPRRTPRPGRGSSKQPELTNLCFANPALATRKRASRLIQSSRLEQFLYRGLSFPISMAFESSFTSDL